MFETYRLDEALRDCQLSLELKRRHNFGPRSLAYTLIYLAEIDLRDPQGVASDALLGHAYDALQTFEKLNDARCTADVGLILAEIFLHRGEPRASKYWSGRALRLSRERDLRLLQAQAWRQLGLAYRHMSNANESVEDLSRSVGLLEALDCPYELAVSKRELAVSLIGLQPADCTSAIGLLSEAEAVFDGLGARVDAAKVRDILTGELNVS